MGEGEVGVWRPVWAGREEKAHGESRRGESRRGVARGGAAASRGPRQGCGVCALVMLVSARMVATTTLRLPAGGGSKMSRCSAVGMREWRGSTLSPGAAGDASSRFTVSAISAHPGTKASTAPSRAPS